MAEAALIVGVLLALLIGAVILGTARKMWRGPITPFDAVGWYLQAALSVLATATLAGAALILKAVVGIIGLQYAYGPISAQVSSGLNDTTVSDASTVLTTARTNDLILGLVLVVGGVGLAALHLWFGSGVPALTQPRGAWNAWGIPVITVAYWGLLGLATLFVTVYSLISNATTTHPAGAVPNLLGDPLGIGLAFTAGWLALAWVLFGSAASGAPGFAPPPPNWPQVPSQLPYPIYPQGAYPAPPQEGPGPGLLGATTPDAWESVNGDPPAPVSPFTSPGPAPPRTRRTDDAEWGPPEPGPS